MNKLTNEQLAVITNPDGHLLVDAGAGSGKTTTVVQALCHQLGVRVENDGVPLAPVAHPFTFEQIAAITFTNQAAADLKRKLRAALRAGGSLELAAEVDSARIGTIHGFCGDLLRDFALRGGAVPGRRVLEEGEATALANDCARDALNIAIESGSISNLDQLLERRRVKIISTWIAEASQDSDRLARWERNRVTLRSHEVVLLELAHSAAELRRDRLDKDAVLDFDQMIVAARDLLHDDQVRHAVQQRIRLLVLDEFQDVDPAQRDIAYLLGGISSSDAAPTRLILVGDPKQSIYRFRRADVTLWNAVANEFRSGVGAVLPLATNFRSKAAILGLVDFAIGTTLDVPVDAESGRRDFEVPYAPLLACESGADGDQVVEILVVPAAANGKARKSTDVRSIEAGAVAQRIIDLHAAGTRFGDIAMLLASWTDVEIYESALRSAAVPLYVLRGVGFWEEREVLDCVLALRAIRDRTDDVALTGFLKSPFIGVRDDTLLALARAANGAALSTGLGAMTSERELLDRAQHYLDTYSALRDRLSTYELLERLLAESGYLAAAALQGEYGPQYVANVRKLLRHASANPDQSLGEFLRDIIAQRDREDRVPPERLYRERSDVVTITSIHSSKGLEWPVVFWCDLVREIKPDTDKFLLGRDGFSVKDEALVDEAGESADEHHKAFSKELSHEQLAETYRLWYVATTRAKNLLILSGIPLGEMRESPSPTRVLRERFGELEPGKLFEYQSHTGAKYHAIVTEGVVREAGSGGAPPAEPALTLPPTSIGAPSGSSRLSATQLLEFEHDSNRWWERYVGRTDKSLSGEASRARAKAIATGLIVHDVLQRLEAADVDVGALIEDAIAARDPDAYDAELTLGASYRTAIRERVKGATSAPEWAAVAGATGARRELPFTRILSDGSTIVGSMDLAARVGGGVRIVDVKATSAVGPELVTRYEVQAAVYSDAVRAIAGVDDVSFTLVAVPSGKAVPVVPTTDVNGLVGKLRAWSAS